MAYDSITISSEDFNIISSEDLARMIVVQELISKRMNVIMMMVFIETCINLVNYFHIFFK